MIKLIILPFFLLVLLPVALATIALEDIAGNYSLAAGRCANKLTIIVNSTQIPAATIMASGTPCKGDTLNLAKPSNKLESKFVSFLFASKFGDFYSATLSNPLSCGNYSFAGRFFIARPEEDLTIPEEALSIFPKLNDTNPNGIKISHENIYILFGSCVYARKAPEDNGVIDNIINTITECLPADAAVHTEGGVIPVEKLTTGVKVLHGPGLYTTVIGWTHSDMTAISRFTKFSFANSSIAVTPGHYVYADHKTIPARRVKAGMVMKGIHGGLRVQRVEHVWKKGLYNPQTVSGDIVVNGVVISTYTEAIPPIAAHALLAPIRAGYQVFVSLLNTWFDLSI